MAAATDFKVEWVDGHREPQCAPDPAYPAGKHLDCSMGSLVTCVAELPYPAKRCGLYVVECKKCGLRIAATTAGRAADPRSLRMPCQPKPN
jgi:hypothetical protein